MKFNDIKNQLSLKNKNFKVDFLFKITLIFFISISALSLLLTIILGTIAIYSSNDSVLKALIISCSILLSALIVLLFFFIRIIYQNVIHRFIKQTSRNIKTLINDGKVLEKYEYSQIKEISEINEDIESLIIHSSNSTLVSSVFNYDNIKFDYFDKDKNILTESSFKKNIREIIYRAQVYRNAIVQIYFSNVEELKNNEIYDFVALFYNMFDYKGNLVALKNDRKGFYLFLPKIDSLSYLKEEINQLFEKTSFAKKSMKGISLFTPRIDVVIYPYSDIDELFSDLEYSSRQVKERLNIHIPDRYGKRRSNSSVFQSTINISEFSKIIEKISSLTYQNGTFDNQLDVISDTFKEITKYLNIDQAGIILYDSDRKKYGGSLALSNTDKHVLFPKFHHVEDELVEAINSCIDPDLSFYFSSRKKVNQRLGKAIDLCGISSGFLYSIHDLDDKCYGLVYFINLNNKTMYLDSFIRQSLLLACNMIAFFIRSNSFNITVSNMKQRENNFLKMANIRAYTIDRKTFEIIDYTPALQDTFPKAKKGAICYKAFFNNDKPCSNCPLVLKQKAIKKVGNISVEVSSSLTTDISRNVELVMNKVNDESNFKGSNRYDSDYLINTFYSFLERIQNIYSIQGKGYVALMSIDNIKELIEINGNDGFSFLVRRFISTVNKVLNTNIEAFLYKSDTIAFILPETGRLDVIDYLEKIFECSKYNFLTRGANYVPFNTSFEAVKFPQEFANSMDFIRHLEKLVYNRDYSIFPTDTIHIEDSNFYRPAGREQYVLSIIDSAVANNTFIVKCQPIVKGKNRSIFGGEILLRLNDNNRNLTLNTEEMIKVAAKNNKLNIISDHLITYIGLLYKRFGNEIFKPNGFSRMAINADYNYFIQENFLKKLEEAISSFHLPKNFLAFEITEENISLHQDSFKKLIPELKKINVHLICDQYSGEYLSLQRLKEIGINEIKADRRIVGDIDVSTTKYETVKQLIERATEEHFEITIVGVENGEQYKRIKGINSDANLQGYYFHHPLSENELMDVVRRNIQ